MVEIKFVDATRHYVDSTGFEAGVPDDVETVEIDFGPLVGSERHNLTSVANMMNKTTRGIHQITIQNANQVSPEFLALFVSLSSKTYWLSLSRCWLSEALHGCLMGIIMNGRLMFLEIETPSGDEYIPSVYQTNLLFEAVASSSSLELLELEAPIVVNDEVSSSLLRALKQNRRLKSLQLHVHEITAPHEILRTVLWESSLDDILVTTSTPNEQQVPLSILIEGLCRKDCKLETLRGITFQFNIDVDLNDISIHNTSLVEMHLGVSNLTLYQSVKFAGLCKSLQELQLYDNPISDLLPLDEILLGESAVLKRLCLDHISAISEEKWIQFFEKIPKMKSLQMLEIEYLFDHQYSISLKNALLDALWQNTRLECLKICNESDPSVMEQYKAVFQKVSIPLCLNRAGRKTLRNISCEQPPLHKGLWPLVLERAMKLEYYSCADEWESPSLTSVRTDAVYWLLREHDVIV